MGVPYAPGGQLLCVPHRGLNGWPRPAPVESASCDREIVRQLWLKVKSLQVGASYEPWPQGGRGEDIGRSREEA